MKKIRNFIYVALIIVLMLLVSCNADILSGHHGNYKGEGSQPETSEIFNGEAPKNVWASPAYFSDRIMVSFDSVPGSDYYEIFKAVAPRDLENVNYKDLDWVRVIYEVRSSSKTRIDYLDTNIDMDTSRDMLYFYTVRAGNYLNGINETIQAQFSDPVKGWTLNPPTSLEVSQGISEEYIELKWTQVDKVKGYRIYYTNNMYADADVWIPIQESLIPAPINQKELVAKFNPPKEFKGKDLFFSVSSVSFKADESDRSGIRNGYTFIPGAPIAPEKLRTSSTLSTQYIDLSWKVPLKESQPNPDITKPDQKGYFWEIYRSTTDTDPELIYSFNSNGDIKTEPTENIPLYKADGKYHFRDSKNLKANVEYEYSVRASCYIKDEATEDIVFAIGKADTTKGFVIGPKDAITDKKTVFPSAGNNGSFAFTIAEAPKGFAEDDLWNYRIYGRNNANGSVESWIVQGEDIPVTSEPVVVTIPYDPATPVNEFSYTVIDQNGAESQSYFEVFNKAIITPLAEAPAIENLTVKSNMYKEGMVDNNGVYPVVVQLGYDGFVYKDFYLEAIKAENPGPKAESAGEIHLDNNVETILSGKMSPSSPGEKWSYRIKGVDVFGRETKWSLTKTGYGAITPEKFIKFFETYVLKPWEFAEKSEFPVPLKAKWNKDSGTAAGNLHAKIDKRSTESMGHAEVKSDFHDGLLIYDSKMSGLAGDVTFEYKNFGELEGIWATGDYTMYGMGLSGSGKSVAGKVEVFGMYPASIDFSSLGVSNYAFSGNYKIQFSNELGAKQVRATAN